MQKRETLWKQMRQDKIFSDYSARKMILAGKQRTQIEEDSAV